MGRKGKKDITLVVILKTPKWVRWQALQTVHQPILPKAPACDPGTRSFPVRMPAAADTE